MGNGRDYQPLPFPVQGDQAERYAQSDLDAYTPNWFVRTFGLEKRGRAKLEAVVEAARERDVAAFIVERDRLQARNQEIDYAKKMLALDPATVADAIQNLSNIGALPFSVEAASVRFTENGRIVAFVDGLDLEDMPAQSVTLLKSGKVSFKTIPQGRKMELLRETVCSAAVRVAVEILQVVPTDVVEVVYDLTYSTAHLAISMPQQ